MTVSGDKMISTCPFSSVKLSFIFLVTLMSSMEAEARELRLLGLLPMTGNGWSGGGSCLPAVQMALEDVNAREDLLQEYNLTYKWIDSKCDAGTPVYGMFEALHKDEPYVMLLGDGCSIGSEATAQVSHLWNLTQFSYGSSSPILSDRRRFPYFFRIVPPDQKMNPARIDLMKEFNWKKVAIINQALEFFSVVSDDFVQRVQDTDISILSQEIFVNDPFNRIENLKRHDARIIMTSLYEDKARAVLCAAYKVGLYGPKIVWVFAGWFSTYFWRANLENLDCTEEEMNEAAEGSFLTGSVFKNPVNERGVANITAEEFEERFYSYPSYNPAKKDTDFVSFQCYDHIWIAAMSLNCTSARLQEIGHPKTLDMFTYQDSDINGIIFDCMSRTDFTGTSGKVIFSTGADPDRIIKIERIQDGERRPVGMYRQDKNPKYFEWTDGALVWKDNNVPRDSTYITALQVDIPASLFVVMTSLAALGICLALTFFAFNIVYRKNKLVKLSSPNINNVLLLGCVMCYCTVFFKTTDSDNASVCRARVFCFSIGFTVIFGALFSKTWRVYRIFTNKKLLRRSIKDYQLLVIIGGLVAVQLLVFTLWEAIGPHRIRVKYLTKQVYMNGNDAEIHPYVRVCVSDYSQYFGWVIYVTQGALLSFGAFLAWETRQVKIEALNDSHQIGLCIYNVVVLSAVGLTLSLLLEEQEILMYGITSGCLIIGTTLTQAVIFIPKIHAVKNKVTQETVSTIQGNGTRNSQIQSTMKGNSTDAGATF